MIDGKQKQNMTLKNKILKWLGLSWFAENRLEIMTQGIEFKSQRRIFEYYREQVDKINAARATAKAKIEAGKEERRRKDTVLTGKVNELLSFLGMKRGSLLVEPPVVEPIINLTRLVEAVQNLAQKAKETNRLARRCADVTGVSQEDANVAMSGLAGWSPDSCCSGTATYATRAGYLHDRISKLESNLHTAESNNEVLRKAHNDLRLDLDRVLEALKLQIVNVPATSTPAKREVRKVKRS